MPVKDGNDVEPDDGLDILTSIDINIQDVAHNALLRQMQANEAGYGCAVLMEVETGFIKAISNISKKGDRVGVRHLADGKKVRIFKSTDEVVDV